MEASVAAEPEVSPEPAASAPPPARRSGHQRTEIFQKPAVDTGIAACAAAKDVIVGAKRLCDAVAAHGKPNRSHVDYYVNKWKGTDVEAALKVEYAEKTVRAASQPVQPVRIELVSSGEQQLPMEATADAVPLNSEAPPSVTPPFALPPIPSDLLLKRAHDRRSIATGEQRVIPSGIGSESATPPSAATSTLASTMTLDRPASSLTCRVVSRTGSSAGSAPCGA
eukprot:893248-Pleurochrysis_carterae.AAC.2